MMTIRELEIEAEELENRYKELGETIPFRCREVKYGVVGTQAVYANVKTEGTEGEIKLWATERYRIALKRYIRCLKEAIPRS